MKKHLMLGALLLAAPLASANAADMVVKRTAPAIPEAFASTWQGFYAGVNAGGGVADYDRTGLYDSNPVRNSESAGGYFVGVQAGYNYMLSPNLLLGLEADLQGSQFKKTQLCGAGPDSGGDCYDSTSIATYDVEWFGTVRGRIGYLANPDWLLYGTGGFAYGQVKYGALDYLPDNSATQTKISTGWTIGAGTEYKISRDWSIKAEYLYVDLGKPSFAPIAVDLDNYAVGVKTHLNIARVGLNYHF